MINDKFIHSNTFRLGESAVAETPRLPKRDVFPSGLYVLGPLNETILFRS
jgi:hypothetical protein